MLNGKGRWFLSAPANMIFSVSSWMAFVLFLAVIGASLVSLDHDLYFGNSPSVRVISGVLFVLIGVAVLAQFVLWFSMMWFCIRYDERKLPIRAACFLAQVFGLSIASALVYFAAYKPQFKKFADRRTDGWSKSVG